jgi:hypothetical protein
MAIASVAVYRRLDEFVVAPLRRGTQEIDPVFRVEVTIAALTDAVLAALSVAQGTSGQPFEVVDPPAAWKSVGARSYRDFNNDLSRVSIARRSPDEWSVTTWLPEGRGFTLGDEVVARTQDGALAEAFRWLTTGPSHPLRRGRARPPE